MRNSRIVFFFAGYVILRLPIPSNISSRGISFASLVASNIADGLGKVEDNSGCKNRRMDEDSFITTMHLYFLPSLHSPKPEKVNAFLFTSVRNQEVEKKNNNIEPNNKILNRGRHFLKMRSRDSSRTSAYL